MFRVVVLYGTPEGTVYELRYGLVFAKDETKAKELTQREAPELDGSPILFIHATNTQDIHLQDGPCEFDFVLSEKSC